MATLTIDLPDNIAKEAKDAGLLTPETLKHDTSEPPPQLSVSQYP